ncbi:MAG: NIPSNAP family protein [Rhodoplanes sp.]|uniref:NIPSNAP family protein n=1 Tax=Rhodoplanes sp. TaxID=1968906 RepID=UPI00180DA18E|nr:NIPSNAP family protein [Rhodoplanes sp.]NVO15727.1 NIPSNAP family protein [Rhodoplanes sp.]
MIYEMRTYELKVGATARYVQQFSEVGLPIVSRYCKLVGYWVVEGGRLNRVVHVWEFESLEQRSVAREHWWQDPEWIEKYLPLALPLVLSQESILMTAAPFSPVGGVHV